MTEELEVQGALPLPRATAKILKFASEIAGAPQEVGVGAGPIHLALTPIAPSVTDHGRSRDMEKPARAVRSRVHGGEIIQAERGCWSAGSAGGVSEFGRLGPPLNRLPLPIYFSAIPFR
jgi:hypothetical protein